MKLRDLPNSVTVRLIASAVTVLAFVLSGSILAELLDSRQRIDAEIRSSSSLAEMVIGYAMSGLAAEHDPEATAARLARDLDHMRHIAVQFVPQGAPVPLPAEPPPHAERAPSWFISLFATSSVRNIYPIVGAGQTAGTLVVTGHADEEIDEIWDELCRQTLWLTLVAMLITGAMIWMARRALRPIQAVAKGMDSLSRGQFTALDDSDVYELRGVQDRFNALGTSLQRASADNRLLIDRMMVIQETEREEIARELHDEVGSALFSIRAGLVSLRNAGAGDGTLEERTGDLEAIIEEVQWRNVQLLERLRPMALDHVSLADALRDLVAGWSTRAAQVSWTSEIDDNVETADKDEAVAIYRVVQECLTNIARHAQAHQVLVRLWRTAGGLQAEIVDDGVGLPKDLRLGYGLLGATERVRKLGGMLDVDRDRRGGTRVAFRVPAASARVLSLVDS